MSLIDLQLDNKEIIQKHFRDLCCDDFTYPFLSGGQSNADNALNQLNIDKYATKRNNVYLRSGTCLCILRVTKSKPLS